MDTMLLRFVAWTSLVNLKSFRRSLHGEVFDLLGKPGRCYAAVAA
jgi:hypothetical protein